MEEFTLTAIDAEGHSNDYDGVWNRLSPSEFNQRHWAINFWIGDVMGVQAFELGLAAVNGSTLKVFQMRHDNWRLRKKGIPEAAIRYVRDRFQMNVESSSNNDLHKVLMPHEEKREESATKVWQRLEEAGEAHYNPDRDVFICPVRDQQ